jgi:hypothetical protein
MIKIEDWGTMRSPAANPFQAPELAGICLRGVVFGHPHKEDGTKVITSDIVSVKGLVVETYSGSTYLLGKPSEDFLKYLAEQGRVFNPENPIEVK